MRFAVLLSSFFFFFACGNEEVTPPLSEEKMAHILADVHTAEAAIRNATGTDKDSLEQLYYQRIMQIHGVSRPDFDTTLAIIQMDPDRLVRVYSRAGSILDSLGQKFDED